MALQVDFAVADAFGLAMAAVGVVVLAVSARYVWRATAVVRADDRDRVDGADDGALVRVSGTVEPVDGETFVAPFSGTDCVALRYSIEERRLGVPLPLPWYVTVHETTGSNPFGVRTPAGLTDVVAPSGTVTLAQRAVATAAPDEEPPDRIAAFEQRVDDLSRSTVWTDPPAVVAPLFRALGLGARRYSERLAAPGDEVTVVGRVDGGGVDPLVVSDRSTAGTLRGMASTSLVGVAVGLVALGLGYLLLVVA